jgi:hypothetical protein
VTALPRPGIRFLVEAVVIVLTAVITGLLHLGAVGIGGAVAVVWVIVAVIEYSLSHPREREAAPLVEALAEAEPLVSDAVRVLPRTPEPVAVELEQQPVVTQPIATQPVATQPVATQPVATQPVAIEPEPESEPELGPELDREPEPDSVEPDPEPEPVVDEPEPVAVVDEPEPVAVEPEFEPEPEPEPESEPVEAQAWNVWEIDRALRETGAVTEEQEFLLLYLRDYAGPDGSLPVHFDELVRESFGDVLGTPAR